MDESAFDEYRRRIAGDYARGKVEAGQWIEDGSLLRAESEIMGLLPEGAASAGHYFYEIEDGANVVGKVWIHIREEGGRMLAWIYDFEILAEFRGQGCGSKSLSAAESKAKELGASEVGLHVFAHNKAAVRLYEKSGYEVSSIVMSKQI